ncbi:LacI family DNA-binding transcriptional regulator [Tessaracoccus oleiagri]|uniref:LacI family transcriptional regulator n=1 Tax=Tessaracoccus oleiagri TaxID=686624 RepID=A0A1G9I6M3_9ACTN|nr:LacI family DNA-binding transcriptional regulator [Tessaracoccus oleiagri]SDL20752.1 LacI family transcriptional regulator [Tessaracoccus oleiagri]
MKIVTVRDVAKLAGVSLATVSRVLNGTAAVSEGVRTRVLAAVDDLGYVPSLSARSLRATRTETIGVVLPDLRNPFFPTLISEAIQAANELGHSVITAASVRPVEEALWLAKRRAIDGLVLVDADRTGGAPSEELASLVPVVAFDRVPRVSGVETYQVDNYLGARRVTALLLRSGGRRFAHIAGPLELDVSADRLRGMRDELAANGVDDVQIVEGDFSEESGERQFGALLASSTAPDAVFAGNDLMAIGAMREAAQQGLRIPEDLQVAGFDGLVLGEYVTPGLTTYEQPAAEIARAAVNRLLELIAAPQARASAPEVHRIEGTLVARGSTRVLDEHDMHELGAVSARRGPRP